MNNQSSVIGMVGDDSVTSSVPDDDYLEDENE